MDRQARDTRLEMDGWDRDSEAGELLGDEASDGKESGYSVGAGEVGVCGGGASSE